MSLSINPNRLFWSLMSVVGILTLLTLMGMLRHWEPRFANITAIFDLDAELTVASWYSSLLHLIATGVCALITWDHTQRALPRVRLWGYLTIVFLLMSINETASLHDRMLNGIGNMIGGGEGLLFYAWVIPGIGIVIGFAVFYVPFFYNLPRKIGLSLILGLGVFVMGSVGIEMISGLVTSQNEDNFIVLSTLYMLEELSEMIGMCIVIWALTHYLQDYCTLRISVGAGQTITPDKNTMPKDADPARYETGETTTAS